MLSGRTPTWQRLFSIQELVDYVGSYLDPPDLFSCVQVHSTWNHVFIPSLWGTIDDSLYHWPEYIDENHPYLSKEIKDPQDWMQRIFEKYGRHIRHLRTNFLVTIDAAFSSTHCVHLRSLDVLSYRKTTKAELQEDNRIRWEGSGLSELQKQQPAEAGPFLAPEFEGGIVPASIGLRLKSVQRTDWVTFQHFWLLVKRNRSLTTLKIGRFLLDLCRIKSPTVFHDLLAALPNLGTLYHHLRYFNGHQLLGQLEHLHSFNSTFYSVPEALDHRKTFNNIRSFTRHNAISEQHVAWIIRDFPNLEHLGLGWIYSRPPSSPEDYRILGDSPLKLKELHVATVTSREIFWSKIISLCPELRRFATHSVTKRVVEALIQHCRKLVELRETDNSNLRNALHNGHFMNSVLESFPDLKIFDCINSFVHVLYPLNKAWVCSDLETFRCQIFVSDRLTTEEEEMSKGRHNIIAMVGRGRLVRKESQCLKGHYKMYDQLSTLTSLKVIDLGGCYRDDLLALDDNAPYYQVDGHDYLDYGEPMKNSMELSLSSGLGRLASLKRIEVFGFEGLDHRIGEAELDWMATAWPRLREIRGLHFDMLQYIEFNKRKAELRKHMRALRPEVKHLGSGCQKDNSTMDDPPVLGPRVVRPWAFGAPIPPAVQLAPPVQVVPRRQFRKALCCVIQ
ncbi:hypothetical protein BGZ96_003026 [Linnemannia gamsii]|uniref:F-box domain-containing protein n=1 Tax=Linnemannia gamsii TaxID=64522 RepID=A0ABQ7K991_9FUNG|nr:hypothetical protein BGZ96_003026 [Linnemannia gamsii]